MDAAHLDKLNDGQRAAVVHGIGLPDGKIGGPLLIIAGAGSGKTNTLAHRVAQFILSGADPRRVLLMTFSRRAATEMSKRVERICAKVLGDKAGILTDALAWSGRSTGSGHAFCANTPSNSGSIRNSPSTTARIPPTS